MEKQFDVFCMCNALFDLQAEVDDSTLTETGFARGGMFLLSHSQQAAVIPKVYDAVVNAESGGSGANTAIGVALLGGAACFTSRVGSDHHGELYRSGLIGKGVKPNLGAGGGEAATGISLILVTPDAERTMLTYLGQAQELTEGDVDLEDLRASRYLYVTGYLWDTESQKAAVVHAMRAARQANVPIALSLSDTFCVGRHRDDFQRLLGEYVDVVFANADEAMALTGAPTPEAAVPALTALLRDDGQRLVAVTRDKGGSLLRRGDEEPIPIPAYPVTAVDTTGAGDMYAAGLLYGLTHDMPLTAAGRLASYAAAQVVGQLGPRLAAVDAAAVAAIVNGV